MALTSKEIQQFATAAPNYDPAVLTAPTAEKRARLLAEALRNATAYYEQAQADVKQSGFRVTQRVRDILWKTLAGIQARAVAPSTVTVQAVSQIAMTSGNEKRHPRVIWGGHVMNWVGFGWVDEGEATVGEKRSLPLVVED